MREEAIVEVARQIEVGGVGGESAVDGTADAVSALDPSLEGLVGGGFRGEGDLALREDLGPSLGGNSERRGLAIPERGRALSLRMRSVERRARPSLQAEAKVPWWGPASRSAASQASVHNTRRLVKRDTAPSSEKVCSERPKAS